MASRSATALFSSLLHSARPTARSSATAISRVIARPQQPRIASLLSQRFAHSIPKPPPSTSSSVASSPEATSPSSDSSSSTLEKPPKSRVESQPHYRLSFTCTPCNTQSVHNISKQGYHHGSVLVTCPGCRNRHVISDHLKIFGDRDFTIEDLMREKGQLVKKGTLGEDGDIEFWEDDAQENKADFKLADKAAQSS
ncbi:hypothetical protein ACHAQA_002320 [Verticillium albo-atrum]